jgi:hypothetical protein
MGKTCIIAHLRKCVKIFGQTSTFVIKMPTSAKKSADFQDMLQ